MNARTIALVSVFLMLTISFAPVLSDDSDAVTNARMSDSYVYSATTDFIEGTQIRNDCLYYKSTNTAAIEAMDALLKDREGTIPEDDSDTLVDGESMKIYYATKTSFIFGGLSIPIRVVTDKTTESRNVTPDEVIDPYSPGFFVKAGDDYSLRITQAVDNYGKNVKCYYNDRYGNSYDLSKTYSGSTNKTTEITISTNSPSGADGRFYIDLTYESSGFSAPSGSAALFAGLCAAVTIAIFCILAYAGLKPRWSK